MNHSMYHRLVYLEANESCVIVNADNRQTEYSNPHLLYRS